MFLRINNKDTTFSNEGVGDRKDSIVSSASIKGWGPLRHRRFLQPKIKCHFLACTHGLLNMASYAPHAGRKAER